MQFRKWPLLVVVALAFLWSGDAAGMQFLGWPLFTVTFSALCERFWERCELWDTLAALSHNHRRHECVDFRFFHSFKKRVCVFDFAVFVQATRLC